MNSRKELDRRKKILEKLVLREKATGVTGIKWDVLKMRRTLR